MDRTRWILAALALLLSSNAYASRLLVLPLLAEGVEAERAARIQSAIIDATAALEGVERLAPRGPTFCAPSDTVCIGRAGKELGADRVLHATLRPLGDSLSLVLLVVETEGNGQVGRQAETLQPSIPFERVIREKVVGLLEPGQLVGSLWVDAPEGSQIFVDGEPRGTTPLQEPIGGLSPGPHKLRVVRGGAAEARAFVEIRFASLTRIRVEPRSDQVAHEGFETLAPAPRAEALPLRDPVAPPSGRPAFLSPTWKWALLGGGGLAVVGGLAVAADAKDTAAERASLRGADGRFPRDAMGREASLRRGYERGQAWATTLFVTGGVLAAGAGGLFLLEALGEGERTTVDLAIAPGGLGLSGRF